METNYWKLTDTSSNEEIYQAATDLLKAGECIAFPTETVYGLGADATNEAAVDKIYTAKGRPSDNPLIVHIAHLEQLESLVTDVPDKAKELIKHFWPGPLTIILPLKAGSLAKNVTAGLQSVGIRMPENEVAHDFLAYSSLPLAAPSANSSGRPSPTTAQHVQEDLTGKIAGIIDGGDTGVGLESTVIDCTVPIPAILRPGGVTQEEIEAVIGQLAYTAVTSKAAEAPKAPGMKYTHYAPQAPVYLIEGSSAYWIKQIEAAKARGEKPGLLISEKQKAVLQQDIPVYSTGNSLAEAATHLYDGLRSFDHLDVTCIFAETYPQAGIGVALMNRLEKAAGGKYLTE